jgi:hypothetical protein
MYIVGVAVVIILIIIVFAFRSREKFEVWPVLDPAKLGQPSPPVIFAGGVRLQVGSMDGSMDGSMGSVGVGSGTVNSLDGISSGVGSGSSGSLTTSVGSNLDNALGGGMLDYSYAGYPLDMYPYLQPHLQPHLQPYLQPYLHPYSTIGVSSLGGGSSGSSGGNNISAYLQPREAATQVQPQEAPMQQQEAPMQQPQQSQGSRARALREEVDTASFDWGSAQAAASTAFEDNGAFIDQSYVEPPETAEIPEYIPPFETVEASETQQRGNSKHTLDPISAIGTSFTGVDQSIQAQRLMQAQQNGEGLSRWNSRIGGVSYDSNNTRTVIDAPGSQSNTIGSQYQAGGIAGTLSA